MIDSGRPVNQQGHAVQFADWQSDMRIQSVFRGAFSQAHPFLYQGKAYWLESRAEEQGRTALVTAGEDGELFCLTPEGFNIRSRVNEYGGKCFCFLGRWFFFNNYMDNRLYIQDLENVVDVRPFTSIERNRRSAGYADLVVSPNGDFLVAVHEFEASPGKYTQQLLAILLNGQGKRFPGSGDRVCVIDEEADFYACPAISPCGSRIAWMQWEHPYMPWDESCLVQAHLTVQGSDLAICGKQIVFAEQNASVCQSGFLDDGRLLFAADSDSNDYWNLFVYDEGKTRQVTAEAREFGSPHWVFGDHRWQQVDGNTVLAVTTSGVNEELVSVDLKTGTVGSVCQGGPYFAQLHAGAADACGRHEVVFINRGTAQESSISIYSPDDGVVVLHGLKGEYYSRPISEPEHFAYSCGDGETAYGVYYVPTSTRYCPDSSQAPPLLVMAHGGPSARTSAEYNGLKQYFSSLGFAIFDANYRGSTGYGRRYRQSLLGNWGETDVDDIIAGIRYLVSIGRADPKQVFIRGSSAGGFTVLGALTRYPDMFAAGASYYGIGNLATLASITHNFESHYTDRLIGEKFDPQTSSDPQSLYVRRSPVSHFENLRSPVILFQGAEDRVVPPALSREVADGLARRNIFHRYVEFPGEGHGFRDPENRAEALRSEVAFYREIQAGALMDDSSV